MPSEPFHRAVEAITAMPLEELPFLEVFLKQCIVRGGGGGANQLHDLQELAETAVNMLREPVELTGWEMALLAGVILQFGQQFGMGMEEFESRQVTGELRRYERQVSNITSAMDSLAEREFVELNTDVKKRSHKLFRVTARGRMEVQRMARRLTTERSDEQGQAASGKVA